MTNPDDVVHRINVEGADPLALSGVNDANLQELARLAGVRVSLRGDQLSIAGSLEAVERATPIAAGMIQLARLGDAMSAEDVRLLADDVGKGRGDLGRNGDLKVVLPGLRRVVAPKTAGQRAYLQAMYDSEIVVSIGPAGTGKTYLAVAVAVDMLQKKRVKRIILARPAVEAGERLGFLPGDLQAKVDPYLRPLYDALEDMMPHEKVQRALETRTIEIAPLAYMRGRTLADAFVILDEAQNTTGMQMKMFLTRLGVNSRAVVTADKTQIDLPVREESGILQVERVLPGIDGVAFCYLEDGDVVRHRLVREIIKAYQEDATG
ncbi:MAG: PhoH family protein [Gemmatimonadales bacterium]|nr:PhoH family protein [Gemmatimonadales bacterium]